MSHGFLRPRLRHTDEGKRQLQGKPSLKFIQVHAFIARCGIVLPCLRKDIMHKYQESESHKSHESLLRQTQRTGSCRRQIQQWKPVSECSGFSRATALLYIYLQSLRKQCKAIGTRNSQMNKLHESQLFETNQKESAAADAFSMKICLGKTSGISPLLHCDCVELYRRYKDCISRITYKAEPLIE